MDIKQPGDKYINTLYFLTKKNFSKGYSHKLLRRYLEIDEDTANNLMYYLASKQLIDTQGGFGDNILLSPAGITQAERLRENKIYKTIKFSGCMYLESTRDAIEFMYYYDIIDESGVVESKTIKMSISGTLSVIWGAQIWSSNPSGDYKNLIKILLQVAKDKITEKLKEGTLNNHEEVLMLSNAYPKDCPYIPDNLIDVINAEFEVEMGNKILSEEIKENKLAALIIEVRDNINAIFHSAHKEKLLILVQERNLLDFFKSANSVEEFSHRIASLGHIAPNLNANILQSILNEKDTQIKSIGLLEKYLESIGKQNKDIILVLRNINRVRQSYPVHSDLAGTADTLAYFNIGYPIKDYEDAWTKLLNAYLTSLNQLCDILVETYLTKNK
ncbi:MAG: hypothetical protein ACXVPU_07335 [Bacteroidia bacterium]